MEASLADNYRDDIEQLVGEDLLHEALDKLQDFVRDLAPQLKNDTLLLRQRFSSFTREFRRGLAKRDDLTPIVSQMLDFAGEVHRAATAGPDQWRDDRTHFQQDAALRPQALISPPDPGPPSLSRTAPSAPRPHQLTVIDGGAPTAHSDGAAQPKPNVELMVDNENEVFENLDDLRRLYWRRYRNEQPVSKTMAFACENISKSYGRSEFRLNGISFALRAGEITGVVGRNASGKTTLLRLVLGELVPDTGKTEYPALAREGAGWAQIKRKIAYVPQLPERWSGRLRNNLNFVAAAYGTTGRENRELVDWYVQRYGLADYEDAKWEQISGGYKIRFELVRALISKPKLLVLDEPLAYLDVIARQEFLKNLKTIATSLEEPAPIIVTSQHLYEIEAVADQMIILDDGSCLHCGPLEDIANHVPLRMVEITLRASQKSVQSKLESKGLKVVEPTMDGFILGFPKEMTAGRIYEIIHESFGDRMIAFRDITNSARSLFKEKATLLPPKGPA
jgi:ABC-type multidrug transport system ATPase subunit